MKSKSRRDSDPPTARTIHKERIVDNITRTNELKQAVHDIYAEMGVVYEAAPHETHRFVFDAIRNIMPRRDEGPYTLADFTLYELREALATLGARHKKAADLRKAVAS